MKWNEFEKLARSKGGTDTAAVATTTFTDSGSLVIERHWSQEIRP